MKIVRNAKQKYQIHSVEPHITGLLVFCQKTADHFRERGMHFEAEVFENEAKALEGKYKVSVGKRIRAMIKA